ncbi:Putative metallo-beta-lactamase, ribonuclease Z/Hydroxyacylglutathione hydrolase [Septoria linicola]|uniref:Metallo-beta-lactamase, ribonuclease Z/Hydroxyacylglutathione hydrolase n=1 Tax=Septoria linicola TaxID=215465 RepID=A0A9Q9AGC5_9PEZI|nr:putative metallo-beta-lactamase, ribonuclease Z/Hydroxyacylglutathione hydrolase [Septoria linicola]USW48919.1 Putative metallo-beta-lactamase, ribonuclease Z/Hydroxyacylglutathione hydrolase [Septoria linicola]
MPSSSFLTSKLNGTTFLIQEHDAFGERPFIYVKLPPGAPVIILSDTGCDEPDSAHKHAKYTQLRDYIENCPLKINDRKPLNPESKLRYIIVCTHCHYDHIGGMTQFLQGGTTEIVASAAGRDFIETDLDEHSLFKYICKPVPFYYVTKWAQAFEKLYFEPEKHSTYSKESHDVDGKEEVDLGITFVQQPGHTPDSLAWYDHDEMWLYVGDTLYEAGVEDSPGASIVLPPQGNLIEWVASMRKLLVLVRSENAKAERRAESAELGMEVSDWEIVPRRVKLAAGHVTSAADAEEILKKTDQFFYQILQKKIPVISKEYHWNDAYFTWWQKGWNMSLRAPPRLVDQARDFFDIHGPEAEDERRHSTAGLFS